MKKLGMFIHSLLRCYNRGLFLHERQFNDKLDVKKMLNVSILDHGNRQPNREQFNDTTIFT